MRAHLRLTTETAVHRCCRWLWAPDQRQILACSAAWHRRMGSTFSLCVVTGTWRRSSQGTILWIVCLCYGSLPCRGAFAARAQLPTWKPVVAHEQALYPSRALFRGRAQTTTFQAQIRSSSTGYCMKRSVCLQHNNPLQAYTR